MFLVLALSSCKEEVEVKNSLSVSPDKTLEFNATGNTDVTLTVSTNAGKWSYAAPEWVVTKQSENTLVVNVLDNDGEERTGSVSFNAGTADEVKINIIQHKPGEDGEVEDGKIAGTIKDISGNKDVKITFDETISKATAKLNISFSKPLNNDANVSVFIDKEYLDDYNFINKTSCVLLPDNALTATEWPVTIPAGNSNAELSIEIDGTGLDYNNYLIPLNVNVQSGDIAFAKSSSRVNYVIAKVKPREVKQMCIMEFNDANPLNVLEYKLADGSYFFDALVLFSGNMGWDADADAVRFNARTGEPVINRNTAALIAEWETYIKPIHDAGIKVYMGIMPHHTAAGITTLSYEGCKLFAQEVAQIIKDCHMDGVFLDEEYIGDHGGPMSDLWSKPEAGGSYFAYQMSKQMDLVCGWKTDVAVYLYGLSNAGWRYPVMDQDDGTEHTVAEYADIFVEDYGRVAEPEYISDDLTRKNCTGASLELKRDIGDEMTETRARQIRNDGYGWIMYFAFNPDPNHANYTRQATRYFKEAARGCYDQELIEPTHYYKKIGEGQYDPNRYPLN